MRDNDLKPCPFCGGKAHFTTWSNTIYCEKCNMHMMLEITYDRRKVVEAWNRRVQKNSEE